MGLFERGKRKLEKFMRKLMEQGTKTWKHLIGNKREKEESGRLRGEVIW